MDGYEDFSLIYKTSAVEVIKCRNRKSNVICCIKKIPIANMDDIAYFNQELMNLYSLRKYPYFLQLLDYFYIGQGTKVEDIAW